MRLRWKPGAVSTMSSHEVILSLLTCFVASFAAILLALFALLCWMFFHLSCWLASVSPSRTSVGISTSCKVLCCCAIQSATEKPSLRAYWAKRSAYLWSTFTLSKSLELADVLSFLGTWALLLEGLLWSILSGWRWSSRAGCFPLFSDRGWICLRLANWLVDWLVGWLSGWLLSWLTGWLAVANWLVDWLVDWPSASQPVVVAVSVSSFSSSRMIVDAVVVWDPELLCCIVLWTASKDRPTARLCCISSLSRFVLYEYFYTIALWKNYIKWFKKLQWNVFVISDHVSRVQVCNTIRMQFIVRQCKRQCAATVCAVV